MEIKEKMSEIGIKIIDRIYKYLYNFVIILL